MEESGDHREQIAKIAMSAKIAKIEKPKPAKRGRPRALLLSIKDYACLAAPEPEDLRIIGEESKRNGTDRLTSREIDRIIKAARRSGVKSLK